MLKHIVLSGLRGFRERQTIHFAAPTGVAGSGLTVFTGPNNSGKSTIIEAVKLRSSRQAPSFNSGMRNAKDDAIDIEYHFQEKVDTIKSLRRGSSETEVSHNTNEAPYVVPSRRYFNPYFSRGSVSDRYDFARHFGQHGDVRGQQLTLFEGRLFEIEKNHSAYNRLLKRVVPDVLDWSIDQNESGAYFIKLVSEKKTHSLAGVGDGIISLFVIIAALFDSQPADLIAVDEPELSLHPSVQRRLSQVFFEYAADRQIVLASHSPYFVRPDSLLNGGVVSRAWERDGATVVHELSSRSRFFESFRRLTNYNVNNPHVFGLDAREIFFLDDGVMVFEGQEDVVLWPRLLEHRSELERVSVYGWGAGGADNIRNVCSVLQALGFQRVCGVLDANKKHLAIDLEKSFPEFQFVVIPADDIRSKPTAKARGEVHGLLDEQYRIRDEFKAPMGEFLNQVERYFGLRRMADKN